MNALRIKLLLALALVLSLAASPVLASVITNAEYWGVISATDNGTALVGQRAVFTLDTGALIGGATLNSTATDAAIRDRAGQDVEFMPGANSTLPWAFFISSINDFETKSYYLYTGGVTGGRYRYFPGPNGMTTADSARLVVAGHPEALFGDAKLAQLESRALGAKKERMGAGGQLWQGATSGMVAGS